MKIEIISKTPKNNLKNIKAIIETETFSFLQELELNPETAVSYNLVSKAQIKNLNHKYRQNNQPTDTLSFPIWKKKALIPKSGLVNLGDIFICQDIVKNNAQKSKTDFNLELKAVVRHSLNHLIGKHH